MPSPWPWIDHPVSGLRRATSSPYSDSLSLRLPYSVKLATQRKSLTHYTKGTQSPLHKEPSGFFACTRFSFNSCSFESRCARLQRTLEDALCRGSHCLYACGFRFYFTPLAGVLFAFPSRYWFTIGRSRVFSLGGWSPHLRTGFLVPRPTSRTLRPPDGFSHTGLSPAMAGLSRAVLLSRWVGRAGYSPFARHYLGNLG